MSDKDFHTRYGVTPREVEDALEENRRRVARRLSEWGYAWAVDEIMCDVAVELLKGGLRRWASYEERKPLGAFVNTLIGNRLGEWMRTERPKYRSGMTHAPLRRRKRKDTTPQREALDATEARRRIRNENNAALADRLCEEADVFGDPDSTVLSAPAGDKSSYQGMVDRRHPAVGTGKRQIRGRHGGPAPGRDDSMQAHGLGDADPSMPYRDAWLRRSPQRHPSFPGEPSSWPRSEHRRLPVHSRGRR